MTRLVVRCELPAGGTAELAVAGGEVAVVEGQEGRTVVAVLLGDRGRHARVELDGADLSRRPLATRVRRGLAVVSDPAVAADVPVLDHLAALVGADRASELLTSSPIAHVAPDAEAGVLSGGERRILAWLRASVTTPRAVLLDRAGTGLDPRALAWAGDLVSAWRARDVALVVRPGRPEERAWAGGRGVRLLRD